MVTLKFHGYSDDTFGEFGLTKQTVDNCANGKPIQCMVDCKDKGRVMVIGHYCWNGVWVTGVTKVDERDDMLPDWNYRYEEGTCAYSPSLLMDLPVDEFNLTWYIGGTKLDIF